MDLPDWINAAEAIGTCTAALLSVIALIVSLRTARQQMKLTASIAEDQRRLMFEQVRMHRDTDILAWSGQCVELLSEAEHFVAWLPHGSSADGDGRRHEHLLCRLSGLIDHGRLFFPNAAPDKKGAEKPAAYQGFRQRILTRMVSAYNLLAKPERLASEKQRAAAVKRLNDLRREFVSEAQLAIDPRRYMVMKELNAIRVSQGIAPQTKQDSDPSEADKWQQDRDRAEADK